MDRKKAVDKAKEGIEVSFLLKGLSAIKSKTATEEAGRQRYINTLKACSSKGKTVCSPSIAREILTDFGDRIKFEKKADKPAPKPAETTPKE